MVQKRERPVCKWKVGKGRLTDGRVHKTEIGGTSLDWGDRCEVKHMYRNEYELYCERAGEIGEGIFADTHRSLQRAKNIGCAWLHRVPPPPPPRLSKKWLHRCTSTTAATFGLCLEEAEFLEMMPQVTENLAAGGWKIKEMWNYWSEAEMPKKKRITLAQFAKKYPKGYFVISTPGHALAQVNGQLVDSDKWGKDDRVVIEAHRLTWPYKGDKPPIFLEAAEKRGVLFKGLRR